MYSHFIHRLLIIGIALVGLNTFAEDTDEYILIEKKNLECTKIEEKAVLLNPKKNYSFEVIPGKAGAIRIASGYNSGVDNAELTCYRCTLKKISKDRCGRYKNVYGSEEKAKFCPNL